jgi:hypothetical protein
MVYTGVSKRPRKYNEGENKRGTTYSGTELNLRMEEFELPVSVNGKEFLFPSKLIQLGYTYRIEIDVNGALINFERDEERHWRALIDDEAMNYKIDAAIVNAIIETLDNL